MLPHQPISYFFFASRRAHSLPEASKCYRISLILISSSLQDARMTFPQHQNATTSALILFLLRSPLCPPFYQTNSRCCTEKETARGIAPGSLNQAILNRSMLNHIRAAASSEALLALARRKLPAQRRQLSAARQPRCRARLSAVSYPHYPRPRLPPPSSGRLRPCRRPAAPRPRCSRARREASCRRRSDRRSGRSS